MAMNGSVSVSGWALPSPGARMSPLTRTTPLGMPVLGGLPLASRSRNALSRRGSSGTRFSGTRAPHAICSSSQRLREKAGCRPAAQAARARRAGGRRSSRRAGFLLLMSEPPVEEGQGGAVVSASSLQSCGQGDLPRMGRFPAGGGVSSWAPHRLLVRTDSKDEYGREDWCPCLSLLSFGSFLGGEVSHNELTLRAV